MGGTIVRTLYQGQTSNIPLGIHIHIDNILVMSFQRMYEAHYSSFYISEGPLLILEHQNSLEEISSQIHINLL